MNVPSSIPPHSSGFTLSAAVLGVLGFLATFAGSSPTARAHEAVNATRGAGENPRGLKLEALARLELVRDDVRAGVVPVADLQAAVEELDDAVEELEESLNPEYWADDGQGGIDFFRLDSEEGHHVFHEERHSAQEIFDAIRHGGIADPDTRTELLLIVDLLVIADRALADLAITEAIGAGGDAEEIDEALAYLAEGDEQVAAAAAATGLRTKAELLYEAIDESYRHAWDAAIDAVEGHEGLVVAPCCLVRRAAPPAR